MLTHRASMKKLNDSSVLVALPVGSIRIDRINGAIRIAVDMPDDQQVEITEERKPVVAVEVKRAIVTHKS